MVASAFCNYCEKLSSHSHFRPPDSEMRPARVVVGRHLQSSPLNISTNVPSPLSSSTCQPAMVQPETTTGNVMMMMQTEYFNSTCFRASASMPKRLSSCELFKRRFRPRQFMLAWCCSMLMATCCTAYTITRDAQGGQHHNPPPSASSAGARLLPSFESKLVVNVRNNGGEVFRQVISSNVQDNYIKIDYHDTDGSIVTQLVDFKNNVRIFRVQRLGEQDLDDAQVMAFCFLTRLIENDFISTDAVSNLIQKNPATIRQAEVDRGEERYQMDLKLLVNQSSSLLSPHVATICGADAYTGQPVNVYASQDDLRLWTNGNMNFHNLSTAYTTQNDQLKLAKPPSDPVGNASSSSSSNSTSLIRCSDVLLSHYERFKNASSSAWSSKPPSSMPPSDCYCSVPLTIPWYPCEIKYCQGKNANEMYRCSIKSCRKRFHFSFGVADEMACLNDFDLPSPPLVVAEVDKPETIALDGEPSVDEERKVANEIGNDAVAPDAGYDDGKPLEMKSRPIGLALNNIVQDDDDSLLNAQVAL